MILENTNEFRWNAQRKIDLLAALLIDLVLSPVDKYPNAALQISAATTIDPNQYKCVIEQERFVPDASILFNKSN